MCEVALPAVSHLSLVNALALLVTILPCIVSAWRVELRSAPSVLSFWGNIFVFRCIFSNAG